MGQLQRYLLRLTHSSPERQARRSLLVAAKRKCDPEPYLALTANYLDLAHVYFGNSIHEDRRIRMDRTGQIFTVLWQHLPYAERLSDFEYMLAGSLIENSPKDGPIHSKDTLVTRIRLLEPNVRFAFLAYEFERWSSRWVALVMRCKPKALYQLLAEARCELCGVSWSSLSREERDCLGAISFSLDKCPNLKANQTLSKRICKYPRIGDIKAQWLEMRPEIVEIRHRYIPSQQEREANLNNIFSDIRQKPMQHPALVDRVVNSLHFSRHERFKVS
ncbi:MAG: hypothetical protein R6U56_01535 [Opitutales bacterium]